MHVLVIAGFLGSGKTTAIIGLARAARDRGLSVAIVVNEIGEAGIDDKLLKHLDFDVRELLSGCICCSLAGDLLQTLDTLEAGHDVDLVLVEPSGAANPEQVISALHAYSGPDSSVNIESLFVAVIVDPLRLGELMDILGPLIRSQIESADLVIVSKADLASAASVQEAGNVARQFTKDAMVVSASLKQGLSPDLEKELLPWLN